MTSALQRALGDSLRSYSAAKASVSHVADALMARGPAGNPLHRPDLAKAGEQYKALSGWVYACVRAIGQRIAAQPVHVGRLTAKRKLSTKAIFDADPLESHELLDLFADPNDIMTRWSMMFSMVASLELTGRCLWWLPKRKQILPIPISWIRGIDGDTTIRSFNVQPPHVGEAFPIPADECVFWQFNHPGDPHGVISPLMAAAGAVSADAAITDSQVAMFRNGINPNHLVIVGKNPHGDVPGGLRPRLTGAQQRQIITAIKKAHSGAINHGDPLILDGLIEDVKKMSHSPAEMDWLNSGKVTKERILQTFGVNPIILGEIQGANRAAAWMAEKHLVTWTVNPLIEFISEGMTEWFRSIYNDPQLVVWIEPCVVDDAEMKLKWAEALAKAGVLTGDEYRELSPLGLKIGDFPDPVSGASQAEQRTEQQLESAMGRVMERTQARALDAALLHRMAGLPDPSIDKQMLDVMQGLDKALTALAPKSNGRAPQMMSVLQSGV